MCLGADYFFEWYLQKQGQVPPTQDKLQRGYRAALTMIFGTVLGGVTSINLVTSAEECNWYVTLQTLQTHVLTDYRHVP